MAGSKPSTPPASLAFARAELAALGISVEQHVGRTIYTGTAATLIDAGIDKRIADAEQSREHWAMRQSRRAPGLFEAYCWHEPREPNRPSTTDAAFARFLGELFALR